MSSQPKDAADERFADWLDGRMAPRDLERFEAELRVNPTLRARAEEYRRTVETVQRALRAPLPKIDVAGAVLARIAARETAAPLPLSSQPWRTASRRAIWYSSGVAAAVFALLALLIEWEPPPEGLDSALAPASKPVPATGGAAEAERRAFDDFAVNEQPGAADGAVLLVQPQPAADPSVVAELEQHIADVRKAEVRQPSGEVPLETASTMLPHVLLQQQASYRDAGREEAAKADQFAGFFLGADAAARDLRRAVPPGTLQVQPLRAAPPPARTATWASQSDREAWLVEGSGPEVYSYLARLSEVGRSCGFEVANGEVATAEVLALLEPAPAPAGQTTGEVSDQLRGYLARRDGEREATKNKAEDETRRKQEASRRALDSELDAVGRARPSAAAPKPAGVDPPAADMPPAEKPRVEPEGAPADRAQQKSALADKDTGADKRRGARPAGTEAIEQKLGAADRSELAPAGAPGTPPPPEAPAPRVRVVLVIERSTPTNR